jgi:ABC-2 type transport system permease protein
MVWGQVRYQNKMFWRTPIAAFFTLVFPLLLFVLFMALFGGSDDVPIEEFAQYFAPGLAVFAAVSATYTNLAINTAMSRDAGILKRVRGTPLPPWVFLAGRIGSAIWIAALAIIIMLGVGVIFYGLVIRVEGIPAAVTAFVVGVTCFSALGLMVAALSPNSDATPAITNATLLPVAFVSDVFIQVEDPPSWMQWVSDFFPLSHFVVAFRDPLDPNLTGAQFHWGDIGYMLLWALVAIMITIRFFKWEPSTGGKARRRRRAKAEA